MCEQPRTSDRSSPSSSTGQERNDELEEYSPSLPGKDVIMTEMMRGCEGPETPAEVRTACQMPTQDLDPTVPDEGGPNVDQEMQWVSTRVDSSAHTPSPNSPQFPTLAQHQGAYPHGSPSLELCEEFPCEEMCRDSVDPSCEEMCIRESTEASCGGRCCELPYEQQCENICKMPDGHFYENQYGEPWPGKARLPSIVVEPSEGEEVESGELRWPPENFLFLEEEEQNELFTGGEEALETGLSSFDSNVEEVLL